MVEQGLGRTVPLNLIKQYYPGYYKKMLEDAVGFHMNRVEGTEDLYYGLTALTPRATHTGYVPLWRLDWLENIGYEPENLTPMKSVVKPEWDDTVYFSTTKFSLDDVKEILRALPRMIGRQRRRRYLRIDLYRLHQRQLHYIQYVRI